AESKISRPGRVARTERLGPQFQRGRSPDRLRPEYAHPDLQQQQAAAAGCCREYSRKRHAGQHGGFEQGRRPHCPSGRASPSGSSFTGVIDDLRFGPAPSSCSPMLIGSSDAFKFPDPAPHAGGKSMKRIAVAFLLLALSVQGGAQAATCLKPGDIASSDSADGKVLVVTMKNGVVWHWELLGACPNIRLNGFSWNVDGGLICENAQMVRVLRSG